MSVDFYWKHQKNNGRVASLNDRDFARLGTAIDALRAKTGLAVDPYANSRISPDHSQILLESLNKADISNNPDLVNFKVMLEESVTNDWWIFVAGD